MPIKQQSRYRDMLRFRKVSMAHAHEVNTLIHISQLFCSLVGVVDVEPMHVHRDASNMLSVLC